MIQKTNKKILVVEDDDLTLKMLADSLREEGFFVFEAIDGKEALDIALKECPDLILLDVVIPEIDGMTVFKRLRESGCCKAITIILLTNLGETEAITEALENGMCDFMIKTDWSVGDVVNRVKKHLENK